jgi:hypothetical protein
MRSDGVPWRGAPLSGSSPKNEAARVVVSSSRRTPTPKQGLSHGTEGLGVQWVHSTKWKCNCPNREFPSYLVNRRPLQFSTSSDQLGNFRDLGDGPTPPSDHTPLGGVVHFHRSSDFPPMSSILDGPGLGRALNVVSGADVTRTEADQEAPLDKL